MIGRLLPLVILAVAGLYLTMAWKLPFGTTARPGAGFFPVAIGVFACVVGLAATVNAFRGAAVAPSDAAAEPPDAGARRRRVVGAVLALAAFSLALPWIGFPAAAFAFVAVVLSQLGSRWPVALATGILSAGISYYLFAVVLDVPLPRGAW